METICKALLRSFPPLTDLNGRRSAQQILAIIAQGAGRMPSFSKPEPRSGGVDRAVRLSGEVKELAPVAELVNQKYRFTGYHKFLDPDGYPAVAPPWER